MPLIYLHHFFGGEVAAGGEVGDRFEVVVLSARQGPVELVLPMFLKRCTTLRGMKTMVPGPIVEVW